MSARGTDRRIPRTGTPGQQRSEIGHRVGGVWATSRHAGRCNAPRRRLELSPQPGLQPWLHETRLNPWSEALLSFHAQSHRLEAACGTGGRHD